MIVIGLTGSIGMGKSATAQMFREAGVPVWDADAAVHRLYRPGEAGAQAIAAAFPGVVDDNGVDRDKLAETLRADSEGFAKLEALIHPLTAADRQAFLSAAEARGDPVAVVDIPLLFETGAHQEVDYILVVSAPPEEQRRRVLARPGMTLARFEQILARQTPDAIKREKAHFVIDTLHGLDPARRQVENILTKIKSIPQGPK